MTDELASWVRNPGLSLLWAAARDRLERNGLQPRGVVALTDLDRPARHALSGLLGRAVVQDHHRVDLEVLDEVLRERSGAAGLLPVLEMLGGPLRNRAAERSGRAASREAPHIAAREWLRSRPDIAQQPWVEDWLTTVRRSGLAARSGDPAVLVRALQVLAELPTTGPDAGEHAHSPVARTEVAARATGDAHALDDGGPLPLLVLRALALIAGVQSPNGSAAKRALWEQLGVSADALSSTCLALGLAPLGSSGVARRLAIAVEDRDPVHLTGWDLAKEPLRVPAGTRVLVCENPRVLEAIAQSPVDTIAIVCTSGVPGLVTLEVLDRLARSSAHLAYHGDFDWPGLAMANRLVARLGCHPWLMSEHDYLVGVRTDGPVLTGKAVPASWDAALAPAMQARAVAVHEEALLPMLLNRLDDLA